MESDLIKILLDFELIKPELEKVKELVQDTGLNKAMFFSNA